MAPKRKRRSLIRWNHFPLLVALIVVVIGTVTINALSGTTRIVADIVFVVIAVLMLVWIFRGRSPWRPAQAPLTGLDGVNLVDAPPARTKTRTGVVDTRKYQSKIGVARAWSGDETFAVLVPGITPGFGFDERVGVQILAKDTFYLVGLLARDIDQDWMDRLAPLAAQGRYLRVPATIMESKYGPLSVDLDLSGARDVLAAQI